MAALSALITENAKDFHAALWSDLRRNWVEADLVDVDAVAKEAYYARQHLREWMRPVMVSPPQIIQPDEVRVRFDTRSARRGVDRRAFGPKEYAQRHVTAEAIAAAFERG